MTKKLSSANIGIVSSLSTELTYIATRFYSHFEITSSLELKRTHTVTIDFETLEIPWMPSNTYIIEFDEDFVFDKGGRKYGNSFDSLTLTTNPIPYIASSIPAINSITDNNTNIKLYFDHNIISALPNTKRLYLYKITPGGNVLVRQWLVEETSITDNLLTINTTGIMEAGTSYFLLIDSGTVYDKDNFVFPGITSPTAFRFDTVGEPQFPDLISLLSSSGTFHITYTRLVKRTIGLAAKATLVASPIYSQFFNSYMTSVASMIPIVTKVMGPITANITSKVTIYCNANHTFRFVVHITAITKLNVVAIPQYIIYNPYSSPSSDMFGWSISISDNYLITSGIAYGTSEGRASVFNKTTGALVCTISNPNPSSGWFGYCVSMTDTYAVITNATSTTHCYLYEIPTGTLIRTHIGGLHTDINSSYYLVTHDSSVSVHNISDGSLVKSVSTSYPSTAKLNSSMFAYSHYYMNTGEKGVVKVYDIISGSLLYNFPNPNAIPDSYDDYYGWAMDMSDSYLAVSADGYGVNQGKVYIYDLSYGTLIRTINNPNIEGSSPGDKFGGSIKIDGDNIIIGATTETLNGFTNPGTVYMFSISTGILLKTFQDFNIYGTPTSDEFGWYDSLDIRGNYIAIGGRSEDVGGNSGSGIVYVYKI